MDDIHQTTPTSISCRRLLLLAAAPAPPDLTRGFAFRRYRLQMSPYLKDSQLVNQLLATPPSNTDKKKRQKQKKIPSPRASSPTIIHAETMVVGFVLHSIAHGAFKCRIEHCHPFRKPTEGFEERKKYREKLMALWMNSVADDLDLITDWWFAYRMYIAHGIDYVNGGMYTRATIALLLFSVAGTISYLAELYQAVFKYPQSFQWLSLFTILFEDVPQVLLSLLLNGKFNQDLTTLDPLASFNIATSLYSALMKVSGELFVNHCYCCKFEPTGAKDEDV